MAEGGMYFTRREDRFLVNLPLFHIGGTMYVMGTLIKGASMALSSRFRTETFWETVERTEATSCLLMFAMATFLLKQPVRPGEGDNPLRSVAIIPFTGEAADFGRRFGADVYTFFDMTETSAPIASAANPSVAGSCGRARPGFEARIVDEHDGEVPIGSTGELMVRSARPWSMSHGYFRDPVATARAFRNGWFHTGDAFRRDQVGNFFFVDRMKDVIRRRGENISSFEVELELLACPQVAEAVAIGVASEHGEEDVMAVVAPRAGASLAAPRLIELLEPKLPRFMLPRYVRFLAELPKTETGKVEKQKLRAQGLTADTWDRERVDVD
jgi:crotonobetaine/carnitine-CoA ligase